MGYFRIFAIDGRYGKLIRAPGMRFVAVTGAGDGIYRYILLGEYEKNFAGEIFVPPDAAEKPTADELKRRFLQARYVLFLHPSDRLTEECAELWETPPGKLETPSLYEVAPESGRLRPVPPER